MPLPDALRRWAMPLLLAALLPAVAGVCVLRAAGSASQHQTASQKAWALADQARETARTGTAREALPLYRAALDLAPEIPAISPRLRGGVGLGRKIQRSPRAVSACR
jgi:hypothetical protein